jgi:hypothetical protein
MNRPGKHNFFTNWGHGSNKPLPVAIGVLILIIIGFFLSLIINPHLAEGLLEVIDK